MIPYLLCIWTTQRESTLSESRTGEGMNHERGESAGGDEWNDLKWTFRTRGNAAESRGNLLLALAVLAVISLRWEQMWNTPSLATVEALSRLVQDHCGARTPGEREKAWEVILANVKAQKLFLNIDLPLEDGFTCGLSQEHQ